MNELFKIFNTVNIEQLILTGGLLMTRIVGMIWMAPFLGGKLVPSQVKIGIAIAVGVLIYPIVLQTGGFNSILAPTVGAEFPMAFRLTTILAKEAFVGFLLGFIIATIWHAAEMIGKFVDTARGSAMGQAQVPQMKSQASQIGSLYYQLILVIFLTLDGHTYFINYFVRSYILIPIAKSPRFDQAWDLFDLVIRITGDLFVAAITLSAPVLIAIFITDICMALFNKVAPQINILFLMMPFKAVLGIAFSMLALSIFVKQFEGMIAQTFQKLWMAIQFMAPF
jgi:flagellar biosynthetic protein FliR